MTRVLLAQWKQETATFNPCPTTYDDFELYTGDDIVSAFARTETEIAGALEVLAANAIEVLPTVAASAVSGGRVATDDFHQLFGQIMDGLNQDADGILLVLHGAMACESEDDPEGALLAKLRERFPTTPIVASLDLHAVLTDRMVAMADVLVPYHTYPHTDHFSTGQRAARCLIALMAGDLQPKTARVKLPMLVRGDELLTATGRFGEAIRQCQRLEKSLGGISAGVLIGNAFTDVPELRTNVLVTVNRDVALADQAAASIGRFMWENRELFQAELTSLADSLAMARAANGLVVFSDAADATASGAAGDSNSILAGLLDDEFPKRALVPIVDAAAVQRAVSAGVDATITVALGGTRDPTRFSPLTLSVQVLSLHDGRFNYEDGTQARGGRVAALRHKQIYILVTERPVYVVGRQVFAAHGLDPVDFDLVVVKSPNGFRTWYEDIAELIVPVDVPGSTSANLRSLPFEHCSRPMFPLDDEANFIEGDN